MIAKLHNNKLDLIESGQESGFLKSYTYMNLCDVV